MRDRKWFHYGLIELQLSNLNVGFTDKSIHGTPWVFTANGLAPFDASVLEELGITTVLFTSRWDPSLIPLDADVALMLINGEVEEEWAGLIRGSREDEVAPVFLSVQATRVASVGPEGNEKFSGGTIVESTRLNDLLERLKAAVRKLPSSREIVVAGWALGLRNSISDRPRDIAQTLLASIVKPLVDENNPSPVLTIWKEVLGDWIIPYDEATRRQRFARAYILLASYLAAWDSLSHSSSS